MGIVLESLKTAPGSLSTGSPAGCTPPHGDGSMCSQANERAGKWLRPPVRALPSVIVDTESGWAHEARGPEASNAWWVERCSPPGAPRKPDGDEPVRSPKNTSAMSTSGSQEPMILSRIIPTSSLLAFEMTIFRNSIQSETEFYCL